MRNEGLRSCIVSLDIEKSKNRDFEFLTTSFEHKYHWYKMKILMVVTQRSVRASNQTLGNRVFRDVF